MQNVYEKVGHSKFVECKGEGEHFRFLSDPFLLGTDFYLLLNEINVSLNRNGLLFKKVTFKILNGYLM
jgi:hypothetical protein